MNSLHVDAFGNWNKNKLEAKETNKRKHMYTEMSFASKLQAKPTEWFRWRTIYKQRSLSFSLFPSLCYAILYVSPSLDHNILFDVPLLSLSAYCACFIQHCDFYKRFLSHFITISQVRFEINPIIYFSGEKRLT